MPDARLLPTLGLVAVAVFAANALAFDGGSARGDVAVIWWLAGMAFCSLALLGFVSTRSATLAVTDLGISLRAPGRRDQVDWHQIEDATRHDGYAVVRTEHLWLRLDLTKPAGRRLFDAAALVVAARDQGRILLLAEPPPDNALSLADDRAGGSADQRAISLTHSNDD